MITVYTLQVPKYVRNRLTRIVCLEWNICTSVLLPVISGQRINSGIKVQPLTEISGIIMRKKARKPNMKGESALKAC
jgi:hypothetical protein